MTRGAFIVFEGCDRAGKSTQTKRLVKWLESRNRTVEQLHFPDRQLASGKLIDQYLRESKNLADEAVHLLFSANRWERNRSIEHTLRQGIDVVCDRYAFSGVAYSAAKGLSLSWCMQPDVGLVEPDAIIFLDANPQQLSARADYGNERYEKIGFQAKVYETYERMMGMENEATPWCRVDALQDENTVFDDIAGRIAGVISGIDNTDQKQIRRLWQRDGGIQNGA